MQIEKLIELAERCEAAPLDQEGQLLRQAGLLVWPVERGPDSDWRQWRFDSFVEANASLDAAMTLVPEGWSFSAYSPGAYQGKPSAMMKHPDRNPGGCGPAILCHAATPALALTAACLKARAKAPSS